MRLSEPIETHRLLLRSFDSSDAETLVALDRDPEVKRFTGGTNPREVSLEHFARMLAREGEPKRLITAVVDRATGSVIGWCGLRPFEDTEEIELFYGYARAFWGRGIATEAAAALLSRGWSALGIDRIIAVVHPDNVASERVLQKLGFHYESDMYYAAVEADVRRYALSGPDTAS